MSSWIDDDVNFWYLLYILWVIFLGLKDLIINDSIYIYKTYNTKIYHG